MIPSDTDNDFNQLKPRVLVLMGERRITGPVKGILQFMSGLLHKDGTFCVANVKVRGSDTSEIDNAFSKHGIPLIEISHSRRNYLEAAVNVSSICTEHEIDIIQTHGYKQSFLGLILKWRLKMIWFCFLHGTTTENFKARMYHKIDSVIQRFSDRTIIVTSAMRNLIPGGHNVKRVKLLHNSVDPAHPAAKKIGGIEMRKQLAPSSTFLFVVVGRLSPEKGVDIFLQSMSLLKKKHYDISGVVIGDGPEHKNLLKLCNNLNLNQTVKFTGYSDVPGDYIEAADALVLPSRSEGIPNVVLEAMALGRPVIATDVGGVSEIIENDISGLIVEKESPNELCDAMAKLILDPKTQETYRSNGLARIRNHFSPDKRVDKLFSLYKEVLPNSNPLPITD